MVLIDFEKAYMKGNLVGFKKEGYIIPENQKRRKSVPVTIGLTNYLLSQ